MTITTHNTRTDFTLPVTAQPAKATTKPTARSTRSLHMLRACHLTETPVCAASNAALDRASHALLKASLAVEMASRHQTKAAYLRQEVNRQWDKLNQLVTMSKQGQNHKSI